MDRLQALIDADQNCTRVVSGLLEKHGSNRIQVNKDEWNASTEAFAARDAARAALMPTEQDAIKLMHEAYTRLKELGWNDPVYCPKDGSKFDAISAGSTGIHETWYEGEWPTGDWWCFDGGDVWPSRPTLYRVTPTELAQQETARERFRALCAKDAQPHEDSNHVDG